MDDLNAFFGTAKKISLRTGEKASVWQNLLDFQRGAAVRKAEDVRHTKRMRNIHQFIHAAQGIQMTNSERNESFARIVADRKNSRTARTVTEIFDIYLPRFHFTPVFASVLLLAMTVGGTVSYAAESALPGEFLYGIKVHINEPLAGSFKFTSESRARYETRRTIRRLEEAEHLAVRSNLSRVAAATISDKVRWHSAKVRKNIESLRSGGFADAAASLDAELMASIQAHENILVRVALSRQNLKNEIATVLRGMEIEEGVTVAIADDATEPLALTQETSLIATRAAKRVDNHAVEQLQTAKMKIEESRSAIESMRKTSGMDAVNFSLEKIENAKMQLKEAELLLAEGNAEASVHLRKFSLAEAEEAKLLVKIEHDLQQSGAPAEKMQMKGEESAGLRTGAEVSIAAAKVSVARLKELLKTTDAAHTYFEDARKKLLVAQKALEKAERALLLDQWEEAVALAKKAEVSAQRVIVRLQGEGELKFMDKADVEILKPKF